MSDTVSAPGAPTYPAVGAPAPAGIFTQPITTPAPAPTQGYTLTQILTFIGSILAALGAGAGGASLFPGCTATAPAPAAPTPIVTPAPAPGPAPPIVTPAPVPVKPIPILPAPVIPILPVPVASAVTVTLPPDQAVSGKVRALFIQAVTSAPTVKWIVFNAAIDNVASQENKPKTLTVFPNDEDDQIVIYAYTASASGIPSEPARHIITVTGSKAPPTPVPKLPPQPLPDAPKSGKIAAHVSFVVAAGQKATADADLARWMSDRGIQLHTDVYSDGKTVVNDAGKVVNGLFQAVAVAGGTPCVVIQDKAGNVIGQGPLTDAAGVKALVAPHTR